MSINLHVIANGEVITPSGKKISYEEEFSLPQTLTEQTHQILTSMSHVDKLKIFSKFYPKKAKALRLWIENQEALGFSVYWCGM